MSPNPDRFFLLRRPVPLVLVCLSVCACAEAPQSPPVETALTLCENPRPELCTQQYDPVCATRDTGVRCVTTPCESTELATYGNACTACSDSAVIGHIAGACE